jgi:hypothetical protein
VACDGAQVDEEGNKVLDFGHIVHSLNKVGDAGVCGEDVVLCDMFRHATT